MTEYAAWVLISSLLFSLGSNEDSLWLSQTYCAADGFSYVFSNVIPASLERTGFHPCYCPTIVFQRISVDLFLAVSQQYSVTPPFSLMGAIIFHCIVFVFFFPGSQQHPGAKGGEGHVLQPAVAPAVALQLPQVATQDTAELPAPGLGDEDSPQWTAFLHRPQQQSYHLGELTHSYTRLNCAFSLRIIWKMNEGFILHVCKFPRKLPGKKELCYLLIIIVEMRIPM